MIPILLIESGTEDIIVTKKITLKNIGKLIGLPRAWNSVQFERAIPTKAKRSAYKLPTVQIPFLVNPITS